jgi:hypothetical protein
MGKTLKTTLNILAGLLVVAAFVALIFTQKASAEEIDATRDRLNYTCSKSLDDLVTLSNELKKRAGEGAGRQFPEPVHAAFVRDLAQFRGGGERPGDAAFELFPRERGQRLLGADRRLRTQPAGKKPLRASFRRRRIKTS